MCSKNSWQHYSSSGMLNARFQPLEVVTKLFEHGKTSNDPSHKSLPLQHCFNSGWIYRLLIWDISVHIIHCFNTEWAYMVHLSDTKHIFIVSQVEKSCNSAVDKNICRGFVFAASKHFQNFTSVSFAYVISPKLLWHKCVCLHWCRVTSIYYKGGWWENLKNQISIESNIKHDPMIKENVLFSIICTKLLYTEE